MLSLENTLSGTSASTAFTKVPGAYLRVMKEVQGRNSLQAHPRLGHEEHPQRYPRRHIKFAGVRQQSVRLNVGKASMRL